MPLTDQPVKGMYLTEENRFFFLQDRKLKTQGRQGGLVIMRMKALDNGQILTRTVKSGTKVEYINPETKEVQYLYKDGGGVNFMDMTTFETITIPTEVVGEYTNFLREGDPILILTYEEKVLAIKENSSVVLQVTQADDAVKGNTANSATKLVTVETGYKLNVPMFVKKGESIKINTETGEYSSRAN